MNFKRINVNPGVCGGKPTIRGLRFPVSRLLGLLACGESQESILEAYPYLEPEDFNEVLTYAAFLADEQVIEFADEISSGYARIASPVACSPSIRP